MERGKQAVKKYIRINKKYLLIPICAEKETKTVSFSVRKAFLSKSHASSSAVNGPFRRTSTFTAFS